MYSQCRRSNWTTKNNRNFFEKLGVLKSGKNTIENFSATKLIALGNEDPELMSLGFKMLKTEIAEMPLEAGIFSNLDDTVDVRKKTGLGKIVKELETQRKNLFIFRIKFTFLTSRHDL